MSDFDPLETNREPREEGWEEQTKEICEHLKNRGDQRIGQFLINAVSQDVTAETPEEFDEKVKRRLWNLEAPDLLALLENFEEFHSNSGDRE